ncbi:glutaredoxin family protein [Dechloromonas denitrificans]|uniref:glutaredoxin family protein n=1 Tax=Dechloromonas denitrificans TaxID=281362 RepID=UPI001CF8E7B4|nr:glutaredoxin domain-containing protein [Dechloromonas denitrificans]UCV04244.1 glutaredoxin family protein [Dechloromonas denitrificans]
MQNRYATTGSWFRIFRVVGVIVLTAILMAGQAIPAVAAEAMPLPGIELFVRDGCSHCEAAKSFLDDLAGEQPGLHVTVVDVRHNPDALARLLALSAKAGIAQPGVPTILVGSELIVGFETPATTGVQIRAVLGHAQHPVGTGSMPVCGVADETVCQAPNGDSIKIPFTSRQVSVNELGLPLFTIVIGLLDGFNPCSMWVLILIISMLATLGDRRRMLLIAGTFIAIEGIAYFGFMAAWLNLFLLVGLSRVSEIAIALLAIVAGAINLKDFLAFGRGISLSIPASAKPGIYARLRAILRAEHLWPALAGTVLLAVLVQIFELLCTSGFPALYTRILTLRNLDRIDYYGYLLLYDAMYMLDDIIVLGIGVVTLSHRRLQEKEGRFLKLVAGLVMLGLGVYLLLPH